MNFLLRFPFKERLQRLRHELGMVGVIAFAALAMTALFYKLALEPMQRRAQLLSTQLSTQLARQAGQSVPGQAGGSAAAKLDAFYSYLGRSEGTTDWLAKLYAIGKATGVELQSATYRSQGAGTKVERYEIVLPATGSYAQMRDFLKRSLGEIPVLSLDQMTLKRESRNDGAVHAELKMTLHMVKP
jgi:hypothetical protein